MLPANARTAIQQIIVAVSSGDYPAALAQTSASRCSAADIARAICEYGHSMCAPPFADWDVVPMFPADGNERWSVRAPLWSVSEDGRSDLELNLTVSSVGGIVSV